MQNFIMRLQRDFLARATVVLLFVMLAGCSALRLGYANGESVLYWWLDGYVDFQGEQKPKVRQQIAHLLAWHRKSQLSDYAQLFAQTEQRIQQKQNVTPADVLNEYTTIKKRAMIMIDRALPELADLALSLQPDQIAHLERKFAHNNDNYRKDYLRGDLEHRQLFRFRKVMKQAEYWFGDFSSEQEARLRAASDARPLNNELWMKERMRRQQEMLSMLKKIHAEKPGKEAVIGMFKEHANAVFSYFTYDQNKEFFDTSRDGTAQMVALMVNIATPEQRAHAVQRLRKWQEDCKSLAGQ
jgi:hypothetical protein